MLKMLSRKRRPKTPINFEQKQEPYRQTSIGFFGNILFLALGLFVSSTAMLAWQVGDNAQVNAYSAYRRGQMTFYSTLPRILTGVSPDLTQPLQLITEGVAKTIVDTTASYTNTVTKTEPVRRLVKELETMEEVYLKHSTALMQAIDSTMLDMGKKLWFTNYVYDLEMNLATLREDLNGLKKPFLARRSAREFYKYKSAELPRIIHETETTLQQLQLGDVSTILTAFETSESVSADTMEYLRSKVKTISDEITRNYESNKYSVGLTYHSGGFTTIRLGPADFEQDFKMIDDRLRNEMFLVPSVILDLIRNQLKLRIILISHESIRAVIRNEKAKDTWKQISNEFKDSDEVINGITGAVTTILQGCLTNAGDPKCLMKSQLQHLPDILREFTVNSFHLPSTEKLLETIIRENSRKNPRLMSFQDIRLLKDIEEFRRNPNIWISLTAISSGLAIGTFVSAIIFGLGYSMLYGIVGSIMNLAGILFDTTASARRRLQMNRDSGLLLASIRAYQQQISDMADLQKTIEDSKIREPMLEELDDIVFSNKDGERVFEPLLLTAEALR